MWWRKRWSAPVWCVCRCARQGICGGISRSSGGVVRICHGRRRRGCLYYANIPADAIPVGAALCRERAAKQPQDLRGVANIAGAAMRPFRDTRPLLQGIA
ncbi:protein of unknown function [Pseudomonas sp. JV551A1]|nr:protein of unknown function [Pseudomonas sp. JV551A1]